MCQIILDNYRNLKTKTSMEICELSSGFLESRVDSNWACHTSSSLECCVVMLNKPLLVQLCPKPFSVQLNSTTGPFDLLDLQKIDSQPEKPQVVLPNTEPISLETVSQLLLNPSLSTTELPWIHRLEASLSDGCYSPGDTFVFALLNSDGEVSFWDTRNKCFLLRMTDIISKLYFSNPIQLTDKNLPEIKNVSESLFISAICWSDVVYQFEGEVFAYFVTVHKSGKIHIWKVIFTLSWNFQLDFVLKHTIEIDDKNVTSVQWISSSDRTALICGNSQGQVRCVSFDFLKIYEFNSNEEFFIFSDKDRISVSKILHTSGPENVICLIIIKLSYFIIFILDHNFRTLHMEFQDLSNRITGIKEIDINNFFISTLNGSIYHLNLLFDAENKPVFDLKQITCNVDFNEWSLRGIYFTKNNAFCIMILTPSKTMCRKKGKITSKIVYTYLKNIDCIKIIFNNDSQSLTGYWDILELFRIYHNLSLFSAEWPIKFSDDMTIYNTKASMWFNIMKYPDYEAKELFNTILLDHIKVSLLKQIDNFKLMKTVTYFDVKTIACCMNFLREHDENTAEIFSNDIAKTGISIIDVTKQCDYCGENFKSLSCSNNHFHQWCCVTLQEIDNVDYFYCSMCKSVAHCNLASYNPKCIFCDMFFEKNTL